jgi:hypothetical protein
VDPHHFDADPNSTYHPDAVPDTDTDSDFYLKPIRMQIGIRFFTLMRIWIQILAS